MKKLLSVFIASVMLLALCACGTASAPAATAAATPAPATPTPAETTALTGALKEINDTYEPGTAGCSLKAAAIAGEMLDWYVASRPAADGISSETSAFFAGLSKDASQTFVSKLDDIYSGAMQTCGSSGADLLSSAGYTAKGTWTAADAEALFGAVYSGTGAKAPTYIAVYSGDDQAERFLVTYTTADSLSPESLVAALVNNGVLKDGVKVSSFDKGTGTTLKLDLSSDFQKQLSSTGTAGEYIMMGCLVNTFLANYGASGIKVTSGGKTITTGHQTYDGTLTMYADNVAASPAPTK
jgi:hypothetical protein